MLKAQGAWVEGLDVQLFAVRNSWLCESGNHTGVYRNVCPLMENQMEKKWKVKWDRGVEWLVLGLIVGYNEIQITRMFQQGPYH